MNKTFNYEKVFMAVTKDRSKGYYKKVLDEDYRLERLIKTISQQKGKMLDIGCGGGTLTECLPYYYSQMKIFGCDISKKAISFANKYGEGKVKYNLIKDKRLPYKNDYFDICLCLDVLEHVPDIAVFFEELKRVLKKNGLFYLAVPCEGQPFTITWLCQKIKIGQKLTYKHVGHIHPEFTHRFIINLLKRNKFIIIQKSYSEHLLYQFISFVRFLLAKELLELFLGREKAEKYYDRSLVADNAQRHKKIDVILIFRIIWLKFWEVMNILLLFERKLFQNASFSGWKIFILAKNIK